MNKRLILSRLIFFFFTLLVLAFLWVFLNGIGSSHYLSSHKKPGPAVFQNLHPGQSKLHRYQRQMVWVTFLNQHLRAGLSELAPYVINPEVGCDVAQAYCVVAASTSIDSIYLQYTRQEPQQLPSNTPWIGGFVDPTSGAVYDLLGRAYKIKNANNAGLPVVEVTQ